MKYLLLVLFLIGCAGQDGRSGRDGLDGKTGSQGPIGDTGPRGETGEGNDGTNGTNGFNSATKILPILPGVNCLSGGIMFSAGLDFNRNGLLDDTEIQHAAFVCNGIDGNDGENGQTYVPSPFAPVDIIDPCGDAPGKYDEILIRLYNGMLVATISDNANGLNTRLAIVPSGGWHTTDNTGCTFTVHSNGMVTW